MLFWYFRIVGLSLWGWILFLDLVAGAVWWFLFGSFFSSCFEEQWLILMIDFCGYVALLQVKLSFGCRGEISYLTLVLWSRPRLRSSRALCLSGVHFYQVWSLEEKFEERKFASVFVIIYFGFCRAFTCSVFILTSWSVLWGIPFPSWKDVLGTPMMYQAMRGLWTSAFVCRGF